MWGEYPEKPRNHKKQFYLYVYNTYINKQIEGT